MPVWLEYAKFAVEQMSVMPEGMEFPRDVFERGIIACGLHVSEVGGGAPEGVFRYSVSSLLPSYIFLSLPLTLPVTLPVTLPLTLPLTPHFPLLLFPHFPPLSPG